MAQSTTSGAADYTWYTTFPIRMSQKVNIRLYERSDLIGSMLDQFTVTVDDFQNYSGDAYDVTLGGDGQDYWCAFGLMQVA